MLINPFSPLTFLKISSLKATIFILLIVLIKTNLLRIKGSLLGSLLALLLISGLILSSAVAAGSLIYSVRLRNKYQTLSELNDTEDLETINAWDLIYLINNKGYYLVPKNRSKFLI